jgi:hypothetical protein
MEEISTPTKNKGGRPKGATGQRSQLARAIMIEMNHDPLRALIAIAKRRKTPLELKIKANAAMLPFAHPKLSTVFIHSKKTVDVYVTQLQELARVDPALAEAMERVSLASTAAMQRQLPAPDGDIIDVTPRPSEA